VAEGKILIAGRIVLEPEPEQSIKGIVGGEKAYRRAFTGFLSDEPVLTIRTAEKSDRYFTGRWGELFVVELPREVLYWTTIHIPIEMRGGSYSVDAYLNSPWEIKYGEGDRFIYLGDFIYRFGEKESTLTVRDGFAAAKAELDGRYTEPDGKPILLVKRLPEKKPALDIDVIETTVTTYYY
ncbi:MAG TPA: hypothetical protein PKW82_00115, partial [Spirochaetales bacterium]|nr:hypothetical protein [Spirochaetales bacterium]